MCSNTNKRKNRIFYKESLRFSAEEKHRINTRHHNIMILISVCSYKILISFHFSEWNYRQGKKYMTRLYQQKESILSSTFGWNIVHRNYKVIVTSVCFHNIYYLIAVSRIEQRRAKVRVPSPTIETDEMKKSRLGVNDSESMSRFFGLDQLA